MKNYLAFFFILSISISVRAQNTSKNGTDFDLQLNTITTAVPFLLIAPDSRSGAMGDAGVAISTDANSTHWNPSKISFSEKDLEVSLGYSPWLKKLVPDINMIYLSGIKKLDEKQGIGASLRYFSLGNISFTDNNGNAIRDWSPNEFAIDVSYSSKLSDYLSIGISGRYINSNLTGGLPTNGGAESKAGQSGAADVSAFYFNDDVKVGDQDLSLGVGIHISNIGSKMNYTNDARRDFIPTNMKLGIAPTLKVDKYNKVGFALDINKLLVPTPPLYKLDEDGVPLENSDGDFEIESGRDPNVGVAAGIFGSFTDAPGFLVANEDGEPLRDSDNNVVIKKGSKFREELRELNLSLGLEYLYDNHFALRLGYFYEHPTKGNRQYFTLGAGLVYKVFGIDLSYLIATQQQNPLANTLRFTLRFNFDETNK